MRCVLLCLSTVCAHVNVGFFSWSRSTERHYKRHFRDTVLLVELLEMRSKNHYNQLLDDIPPNFNAENCLIILKLAPEIGVHQLQILSIDSPVKFKLLLLAAKPQKGIVSWQSDMKDLSPKTSSKSLPSENTRCNDKL